MKNDAVARWSLETLSVCAGGLPDDDDDDDDELHFYARMGRFSCR